MSLVLPPEPVPVLVNKGELAGILGVTVATLSAWIAKRADFPVYERGTQGREWRFDAAAVVAFVTAMQNAERAAEAERAGRVAQLGLPLTDPGATPAFSLADLRAASLADRVRTERQFLVERGAVAEALAAAVTRWDGHVAELLARMGRDLAIPDGTVAAIGERLAEARHQFTTEAARALGAPGGGAVAGGLPFDP